MDNDLLRKLKDTLDGIAAERKKMKEEEKDDTDAMELALKTSMHDDIMEILKEIKNEIIKLNK